eukprot:CAMPEP_0171377864 /NCGR_PEP_ID=MMETSP0879-20121228/22321_1 /TAXON_ID=67004 /ORGANISM="Thalassiosira weissflogii, Strain CCMP1336" /LENGTH=435 /DNA_ID=CAMNT_0011888115 /DNA_START=74 /DNA_END=1381 /DNA_ORIENTATION=+
MESNNFTPNNTDGKKDNPPKAGRFSPDPENSQQLQQEETPLNSLDPKYIYRDFSHIQPSHSTNNEQLEPAPRTLPAKLNSMLSDSSLSDIITWLPHGRSWRILDRDRFTHEVLPKYFEHSNFNSFVRLVNAWGFRRVPHGIDVDSHYHELFLRGMPHLHARMKRTSLIERKAPIDSKDRCPNFSSMPPLSGIPLNNNDVIKKSYDYLQPQQRQDRENPNGVPRANNDVEQRPNQIRSVMNPSNPEIPTSPHLENHSIANAPIQNNIILHPSVFISNPAAIQITSPVGPLHQMFPFGDPNSCFVQQQISSIGSGCSQPQLHPGILQPQQYQLVPAQLLLQQQQQQQQLFIQPPLQHSQHHQHLQNFLSMVYLHPNIGNQAIALLGNINPLPPQQIYNTSFPLHSDSNGVNPQQFQLAMATSSLDLAPPQLNSANLC